MAWTNQKISHIWTRVNENSGYSVFVVFRKKAKALTSYYYNCATSEAKNIERTETTVSSHPKRRKRQDGIRNREECVLGGGRCQWRIKRRESEPIRTSRLWSSLTSVKQRERKNGLGRNQAIIWRECSSKGRNKHKAKTETEHMKPPVIRQGLSKTRVPGGDLQAGRDPVSR